MNNIEIRPPLADVSFLFADYTKKPISIRFHAKMYPIEREVEANWVWHAFRGMARLNKALEAEGRPPQSFAAVGTGSGVDAIGAGLIFPHLKSIAVTDIEESVLAQALENVRANVPAEISVNGRPGDCVQPSP